MHVSRKNWFRNIRTGNWFSFRYNWLVFTLFILLTSILSYYLVNLPKDASCKTNSLEIIKDINHALEGCCQCKTKEEGLHFPADYLIITYQFSAEGGRDLDTRTGISAPLVSGPLGFCNQGAIGAPYLFWSGDNRGTGVESYMIDLTKFQANDIIRIDCAGHWYSIRNNGDMALDIKAYEGGTMSKEGYQFINTGGQQSAETSFSGNVTSCCNSCDFIQPIGTITYNKQNKTLHFDPNTSNQQP
jgi:hypothetical protein